eukprot:Gb_35693 [translate_table: standard]
MGLNGIHKYIVDFMERTREGRRGGNGSGNVSASRRPRTSGLREVFEDDNQHSRLQSRKDGPISRKRRIQRDSLDELQKGHQGRSHEMEESFEDTEMAGSEEDDDLPPPTIRRRSGKLKIHFKAHEDASTIDMAMVPRKIRTAMMKRSTPPPNAGSSRKPSNVEVATAAPTCSNSATFNGRRTKPNNPKLRSAKFPKISPATISEQEAEVAETLYDLARMFSSQSMTLIPEPKSEPNSAEMKSGSLTGASPTSPTQHSSSPTAASSPSSTHNLGVLEAPNGKLPHVSSNSEEARQAMGDSQSAKPPNPCLTTSSLGVATKTADAEKIPRLSFDKSPFQAETSTSPPEGPLALSMIASTAGSPISNANATLPAQVPQTVDNPTIQEDKVQRIESGNHASLDKVTSTVLVENKVAVANPMDAVCVAEKDSGVVECSVARETISKLEFGNRQVLPHACHSMHLQLSSAKGDPPSKTEMDLMPPFESGDKINDVIDSTKVDVKEEREVDLATIPATGNSIIDREGCEGKDKTKNVEAFKEDKQIIEKILHDCCKDWEAEKRIEQLKETSNQSDFLKDKAKHEADKQPLRGAGKNAKADSSMQKVDRSASGATTIAIASESVTSTALPISMGMPGWPGGLPPLGYAFRTRMLSSVFSMASIYYSPAAAAAAAAAAVAAAWPVSVPMTGTSSVDKNNIPPPQVPSPFLQTRQSWKRSATHVYITHFIDSQQQVKQNPLWAAAYGNSTGLYGLNIPIAPANGIFGNSAGSGLMGLAVSTPSLGLGSVNDGGFGMAAVGAANILGAKDKSSNPCIDAHGRQPPLQQQSHMTQQQSILSSQARPTFEFPVTQSTSASVSGLDSAKDNVGVTAEAMLGGRSCAYLNSSSVGISPVAVEGAPSNPSVANAAAVQAQLLQSVIRQSTFPYSISHGRFGPILSPQQVAQYYSNSFFGAHLVQPAVHPHQSELVSNLTSEAIVSQRQQQEHCQVDCSSVSSGTPQQHQQTLGICGAASQLPDCVDKKVNVTVHSISAADLETSQERNVYVQNSPSLQVSSVHFPSSILAASMPTLPAQPQDSSSVATFAGKQTGKMHQQQAQPPLQSQHPSTMKLQRPQQHVATQNHIASSALQGANLYVSQPLPATGIGMNKSSDTPGPLAASSVMGTQGEAFLHRMGGTVRGLGNYQISPPNQLVSLQSHQASMPASQLKQQQCFPQTQRSVLASVEDGKTDLEEGSYSNGGRREDRKSRSKPHINQSNTSKVDLEASPIISGSPTNETCSPTTNAGSHLNIMVPCFQGGTSVSSSVSVPPKQSNQSFKQQLVKYDSASNSHTSSAPALVESTLATFSDCTSAHPVTYCKMPTEQGVPFPGQTVIPANHCVKQGGAQHQGKNSRRSSAGSTTPATSGFLPQAMLATMIKTQGQQSGIQQSATNVVSIPKLPPVSSISSSGATSIPSASPVSKARGVVSAKNSSVKDSYSLPPKLSSGVGSGKKALPAIAPNVASVLGSSPQAHNVPSKPPNVQLINNQYNILQQHMPYPQFQQTVQPMVSVQQKLQQPAVPQQYTLHQSSSNQQQVLELHKQPLTQQQQHQFRQHLLIQQKPQYVQTQSHLHAQTPSQQPTMHLQQTTQHMKQQSGQMSSQSQQLGNKQQKHFEQFEVYQQMQSAPPTTLGIAANVVSSPTLSLVNSNAGTIGNIPPSAITDGSVISESNALRPSTPAKISTDTSTASSSFQRGSSAGSTFLCGPSNSATLSQQQISNSSIISLPCPNSVLQPMSNSDRTEKWGPFLMLKFLSLTLTRASAASLVLERLLVLMSSYARFLSASLQCQLQAGFKVWTKCLYPWKL